MKGSSTPVFTNLSIQFLQEELNGENQYNLLKSTKLPNAFASNRNQKIFIFWRAACTNQAKNVGRKSELAKQFLELVDAHFQNERSVAFYADQMCITRAYLRQICQKVLVYNPGYCIGLRVCMESASLLTNELHPTIKEVAHRLGFEDAHYFSRFFKKYMNTTPKNYREQYMGK